MYNNVFALELLQEWDDHMLLAPTRPLFRLCPGQQIRKNFLICVDFARATAQITVNSQDCRVSLGCMTPTDDTGEQLSETWHGRNSFVSRRYHYVRHIQMERADIKMVF